MALYRDKPTRDLLAEIDPKNPARPQVVCWQFMSTGHLAGITGAVDMSFLPAFFERQVVIQ